MGRETVLFKSEEKKSRGQVAEMLRLIADKVEQGRVSISSGSQGVDISIPQNVVLEIKVEEETKVKTKKSLEIEIEWVEGGDEEIATEVKID